MAAWSHGRPPWSQSERTLSWTAGINGKMYTAVVVWLIVASCRSNVLILWPDDSFQISFVTFDSLNCGTGLGQLLFRLVASNFTTNFSFPAVWDMTSKTARNGKFVRTSLAQSSRFRLGTAYRVVSQHAYDEWRARQNDIRAPLSRTTGVRRSETGMNASS